VLHRPSSGHVGRAGRAGGPPAGAAQGRGAARRAGPGRRAVPARGLVLEHAAEPGHPDLVPAHRRRVPERPRCSARCAHHVTHSPSSRQCMPAVKTVSCLQAGLLGPARRDSRSTCMCHDTVQQAARAQDACCCMQARRYRRAGGCRRQAAARCHARAQSSLRVAHARAGAAPTMTPWQHAAASPANMGIRLTPQHTLEQQHRGRSRR